MKKIIFFIGIIIIFLLILSIYSYPINKNAQIIITNDNNEEICYVINNHLSNKENISKIKKRHIDFIIGIEDKNFYSHNGFDLKRIISSIFKNIFTGTSLGASTITQQYIKNTYLKNEKSISRKIKEIMLAIKLENSMTKDEILSNYLSSIYFGNNVYGLTNAAKYYFNKTTDNMNDIEMISLIALWNSPSVYSQNIDKWEKKKNSLVDYLYKINLINHTDKLILKNKIPLNINKSYINPNKKYFIDQVILEFKEYKIHSSFNENILISTKYNSSLESIQESCDASYCAIITNKEGYIISIFGDKSYTDGYNIAINGKRDIGSTIKPILYYEAIKCGLEHYVFDSSPYSYLYNNNKITVTNSSGFYYGPIDMRHALAVSDNIYATKMHLTLGTNTLARHLKKYGINASPIPSLALGSISLSLKELNDIYTQFFTDGKYIKTKFISSINYNGINHKKPILEKRLNDSNICLKIKSLLSAPFDSNIKHSTLSMLNNKLNTKAYGKTGSTLFDSYVIGFNDDYLISVWSGYKDGKILEDTQSKHIPKILFTKIINTLTTN